MKRTVSTWSLHRTLGRFVEADSATLGGPFMDASSGTGGIALLELPRQLKAHGYEAVQIVHFHLPSVEPVYLAQLRAALQEAGVELDTLLIDDGDLMDPKNADRTESWIGDWLDVAVALGATRARVVAGQAEPTPERLRESARRLVRLARAHPDVRLVTENWKSLLPDGATVRELLRQTGNEVGLLIDLGNWSGPGKYDELALIAPLAETCHAKCRFVGGEPDADDFLRALRVLKDAAYDGPLALIYDGADDDEWAQLDVELDLVRSVFG